MNLVSFSFGELGLSPNTAMVLILLMLIGSLINIPLTRHRVAQARPDSLRSLFSPPPTLYSGVAVNLGGAVIPLCLSIYLGTIMPSLWQVLVATGVMALVTRATARFIPGRGIVVPMFIPPILSALLAMLLAKEFAAPVAYVAGTMGTLIGADILNLHRIRRFEGMVSIGGAGLFDGIFLVGIVAVFLTALV
ncbi:MAG: DUF1614 domain-containing protein [Dehalococcoidia bacterium]|nr:DUF1614 domain-containing protein [Dehalococcoidia bacterium]